MGVSKTTPKVYLTRLLKVKERVFALPRGQVLPAKAMAKHLGVSLPVLRRWCDDIDGFEHCGAFERGAEGIEYEFCPVRTVWFLIDHFAEEARKLSGEADKATSMAGAVELFSEGSGLTPEELSKTLTLAEKVEAWKIRQGLLVDGEEARSNFNIYHQTIQQVSLRSAQEEDPEGTWPPEMRKRWEARARKVLIEIQKAGRKCAISLGSKETEPA